MDLGPTYIQLNFETDLDNHMGTKKIKDLDFQIYLLLYALGGHVLPSII